jgi:formylglycine-generating enzyme required for sulfatase activity
VDNKVWDKFYKGQANAAVSLIRMGRPQKSLALLKHGPDPSLRSYLVHCLGPLGVEPNFLIAKLDQESDVSIRRALILSLGEYGRGRIWTTERDTLTKRLLGLYRTDPDPGIHGAAEWLLRQWGNEKEIKGIDKELTKLPLPTVGVDQGPTSSQGNNRRWYINSQGQALVIVRGPVEFDMGEGANRHRERIDHSFAIATKEVSVDQFQKVLKENPHIRAKNYEPYSPEPSCPMNSVSWYDATAYCNWLSKQEGLPEDQWYYGPNEKGDYAEGMRLMSDPDKRTGYRLPTEAEWEHSCRAETATRYSFGEPWELLEKYGWYSKNSPNKTHPVGILKPNDLGLFDVHGNLYEWCHDQFNEPGENRDDIGALWYINDNTRRILRGGAFNSQPALVRSAHGGPLKQSSGYYLGSFRPSRTLP